MKKTLLTLLTVLSLHGLAQDNSVLILKKRHMNLVVQEGDSIGVTIKTDNGELSTSGSLEIISNDTILVGGKGIVVADLIKILAPPTTKRKVGGYIKTSIGALFTMGGITLISERNRGGGTRVGMAMILLFGTPFLFTGINKLANFETYHLKRWSLAIIPALD
jgi:hypothetical protein